MNMVKCGLGAIAGGLMLPLLVAMPSQASSSQQPESGKLDCASTKDSISKTICSNDDLLAKHKEVQALLVHAGRSPRKDAPGIKLDESNTRWLERRARCEKAINKTNCLSKKYNTRLAYLEAKFRPGKTQSESWKCDGEKEQFTLTLTRGKSAFGDIIAAGLEMKDGYHEWFLADTGKTSEEARQFAGENDFGGQAAMWLRKDKANFIIDRRKFGLVCTPE